MSTQRMKMRGKHRKKPPKPYERVKPKSFLTKVKNFLNPWSWSTTDDDVSGEVVDSHEDCSSGDEEFQSASGSPVTVTPQQETEQGAIPVIIETEEEPSSSASFGPGARQQTMSASLTANFLSGDIQNSSFRSKATIGSLSSDIFHDSKMKSIFTDTPRMAYPRSSVRRTSDVSARGLLASDLSTRATMGSDTSSQCDLSELDRYDGGSVAEEATRSEAEDKQFPPAALLSTSHVHKQRGHSSLHILPLSSTSSSSAKNFTDLRRRFAPNTSLSSNLFTSTPRLSQERQAHQAATPQAKTKARMALQSSLNSKPVQTLDAIGDEVGNSPTFSLPAFVTPTRQRTSLSRTPFNSPFYQSGRTSYFSSGQRRENKRTRPESPSSPELPPLRQKVSAKPLSMATATTQTAKKILHTLESFSSPLENVRRLPPRHPVQPSAKRRRAQFDTSSAPPTLPLLVPTSAGIHPVSPLAPLAPTAGVVPPQGGSSLGVTGGQQGTFKAPPVVELSGSLPVKGLQPLGGDRRVPPVSVQPKGGTTKLVSPRRRSVQESERQENPLDVPPPVGLSGLKGMRGFSLDKDPSLPTSPTSSLTSPRLPSSTVSPQPLMSNVTSPKPLTTSGGSFTFSAPLLKSPPSVGSGDTTAKSYLFSPPRVQAAPQQRMQAKQSKNAVFSPGKSLETSTKPLPPPSLPQSALEALNAFKEAGEKLAAEVDSDDGISSTEGEGEGDSSCEVVSLSSDEETPAAVSKNGSSKQKKENVAASSSEGSLKPLTQFAPVSGSWECSSCLVQNTPDAVKCVCCEAKRPGAPSSSSKSSSESSSLKPLTQFAPVSGSWECSSCLVQNTPDTVKCVCCGVKKPGAASSASKIADSAAPLSTETTKTESVTTTWTCDTCLVPNKSSSDKCVCCETPKPGASVATKPPPSSGSGGAGESGFKPSFKLPTLPTSSPSTTSSSEVPLLSSLSGNGGGLKLNFPLTTSVTASTGSTVPTGGLNLSATGGLKLGGLLKPSEPPSTTSSLKSVSFRLDSTAEPTKGDATPQQTIVSEGGGIKLGGLGSGPLLLGGLTGMPTSGGTSTLLGSTSTQRGKEGTIPEAGDVKKGGLQLSSSFANVTSGSLAPTGGEKLDSSQSGGLLVPRSSGLSMPPSGGLKLGDFPAGGLTLGGSGDTKMAASETSTPKVDGLESSGLKLGGLGSGGLKMGGFKSSDLKLGGSEVDGPKLDVPTSSSLNVVTSGSSVFSIGSSLVSSEKPNNPFTLSKQQQQQQQPSLVTGTLSPDTQKMNQTGKMDGMGLFAQLKGTPTSGTGLNLTMGSSQFGDLKIKFPTSQPSLLGSTTQPSLLGATTQPSRLGSTTQPSLLGATTQPSLLGSTTQPSLPGATTQPSLLGATPQEKSGGLGGSSLAFPLLQKQEGSEEQKPSLTFSRGSAPQGNDSAFAMSLKKGSEASNLFQFGKTTQSTVMASGSSMLSGTPSTGLVGLQGLQGSPLITLGSQGNPLASLGSLGSLNKSSNNHESATKMGGSAGESNPFFSGNKGGSIPGGSQSTMGPGASMLGQGQSPLGFGSPTVGDKMGGQSAGSIGSQSDQLRNPFASSQPPALSGLGGQGGSGGLGGAQQQQNLGNAFVFGGQPASGSGSPLVNSQTFNPNLILGSGNQNTDNPFLNPKPQSQSNLDSQNFSQPTQTTSNLFSPSPAARGGRGGRVIKRAVRRRQQ